MGDNIVQIDPDLFTVIVEFDVAAADGESFLDELTAAAEASIVPNPGFRSSVFQISSDHTRVVNYAQWDSEDAYRRSMTSSNPGVGRVRDVVARHGARMVATDFYSIAATFTVS